MDQQVAEISRKGKTVSYVLNVEWLIETVMGAMVETESPVDVH